MRNPHAVFESLAGALALGEATTEERAAFAAHAMTCETCRGDAQCAQAFESMFARARAAERWRPSVARALLERIADSRGKRSRFTVSALGWAIALSIVLNVAFASGLTNQLSGGFHTTAEPVSSVATTRIQFDRSPHHAFALQPHAPAASVRRFAPLATQLARKHRASAEHSNKPIALAARAAPAIAPTSGANVSSGRAPVPAPEPPVADVLDGFDIDRDAGARRVANLPSTVCERTVLVVENAEPPCPAASPGAAR